MRCRHSCALTKALNNETNYENNHSKFVLHFDATVKIHLMQLQYLKLFDVGCLLDFLMQLNTVLNRRLMNFIAKHVRVHIMIDDEHLNQ